jgi:hypothetical protein
MRVGLLGALALLVGPAPAFAVEDIPVDEGAGYRHERTDITFPSELGGMPRNWLRDFGADRYDVAAIYESADKSTFLSVYVYRAGLPDTSLWFDRLVPIMAEREGSRPAADATLTPAPFTPTGSDTATGLALAYDTAPEERYKATGALIFPHGPWLIKFRATSARLDAEAIAQLLKEVESSLYRPEPDYLSPAAYLVKPCATQLATGPAKALAPKLENVVAFSAVMGGIAASTDEEGAKVPLIASHWCRDAPFESLGVYRPDEATDRYVLAIGDSGNVVQVGVALPQLPGMGRAEDALPLIFSEAERTTLLAILDRAPTPAQAIEIANGAEALAISDREGNIELLIGSPDE